MDLGNALNSTGTVAYLVDGDHNTGSNYKVNIGELVMRTCLFFLSIKLEKIAVHFLHVEEY